MNFHDVSRSKTKGKKPGGHARRTKNAQTRLGGLATCKFNMLHCAKPDIPARSLSWPPGFTLGENAYSYYFYSELFNTGQDRPVPNSQSMPLLATKESKPNSARLNTPGLQDFRPQRLRTSLFRLDTAAGQLAAL
ncbi:hypothetical protein ACFIQF_15995 [Comamonas sp. J-3]|uniref:hypothetical protein n=1 Tax=Comamonas trifloxystrobinivorans TaxID=3350256 RepID=UPI00372760B0